MAAVDLHAQGDHFARLGIHADHVAVMVAVGGDDDLGGIGAEGLAVHPEHGLIALGMGHEEQGRAGEVLRHGVVPAEEAVDALVAPGFAGVDGAVAVLGDLVEGFLGLHQRYGADVIHLVEDQGFQGVFIALELSEQVANLGIVNHGKPPCA